MPKVKTKPKTDRTRLTGLFAVATAIQCHPSALRQCLVASPRRNASTGQLQWELRRGGNTIPRLEQLAGSGHAAASLAAHLLAIRRLSERGGR